MDEEAKDQVYLPVGISRRALSRQQLGQLIVNYTGEVVDIFYREIEHQLASRIATFGVLFVPKRQTSKPPLFFGKNGPDVSAGKPVFLKDEVYFRLLDSCVPASKKQDYVLLFGARDNPYLWDAAAPDSIRPRSSPVTEHTLPDKNLICPHFVGRVEMIKELWRWLGDEFVHVKLLVGDGGKGKTSIAYNFAREVCTVGAYGLQKVIWLTAKSERFVGGLNKNVPMPEIHFSDTNTLLRALGCELAILPDESSGAGTALLKKIVKRALEQFPCLVIVDNVDSAEVGEQKEILNATLQLAGPAARFLVTTRMNFALGRELAITVGGLEGAEYREYVSRLATDFHVPEMKSAQVERLRVATDGSPLFTESVFRLLRTGMKVEVAIRQWQGKLGTEVRNAALRKEIQILSPESRRLLLACSLMGTASLEELKHVTRYIEERIHRCLEELQALFLLPAPALIKGEPRFSVSNSTRLLVIENSRLLVPDPAVLERRVKALQAAPRMAAKNPHVGAAISQATAMLGAGRHPDAIATIDAALKAVPRNRDLLSMRGLCLLAKAKSDGDRRSLQDARAHFRESYELGHRKIKLYEYWYESEMIAGDWNGALEVAGLAIHDGVEVPDEWYRRRASVLLALARSHRSGGTSLALENYRDAADDIANALISSVSGQPTGFLELLCQIHDEAWRLQARMGPTISDLKSPFEDIKRNISRGDRRLVNAERLVQVITRIADALAPFERISTGQRNFLEQSLREGEVSLKQIGSGSGQDPGFSVLMRSWRDLRSRAEQLLSMAY